MATRYLCPGEHTREGDIMRIGDRGRVRLTMCRYGHGCCIGHAVEEHEDRLYEREEMTDATRSAGG